MNKSFFKYIYYDCYVQEQGLHGGRIWTETVTVSKSGASGFTMVLFHLFFAKCRIYMYIILLHYSVFILILKKCLFNTFQIARNLAVLDHT